MIQVRIPAIKIVKPDFYLKGEEYKDNSKDITKKIKRKIRSKKIWRKNNIFE